MILAVTNNGKETIDSWRKSNIITTETLSREIIIFPTQYVHFLPLLKFLNVSPWAILLFFTKKSNLNFLAFDRHPNTTVALSCAIDSTNPFCTLNASTSVVYTVQKCPFTC